MYKIAIVFLLSISATSWANPLILTCTMNGKRVSLDVESLVTNGCKSKDVRVLNGQLQSRYHISLCNGTHAQGTVEVLGSMGGWTIVDEFSTDENCRLFRSIATNYPCTRPNRYGHRGGCN